MLLPCVNIVLTGYLYPIRCKRRLESLIVEIYEWNISYKTKVSTIGFPNHLLPKKNTKLEPLLELSLINKKLMNEENKELIQEPPKRKKKLDLTELWAKCKTCLEPHNIENLILHKQPIKNS